MGHVMDALARLDGMAAAGSLPGDVAREAEVIAAGWWWNAQGDLTPDRLVLRKRKPTSTFRRGMELTRLAISGCGVVGGVGERGLIRGA